MPKDNSKRLWNNQCCYPFNRPGNKCSKKFLRKPTSNMIQYLNLRSDGKICNSCFKDAVERIDKYLKDLKGGKIIV